MHCYFQNTLIRFCFPLIIEADFTSSVDALSSQKEKADRHIEQLQQEIEDRNNELAAMKEEEANQQEEKQLLLDEVQQLSEAVELLKDKDVNIARLEEELELLTEERAKLGQQLASAEEELTQLKEANEKLQVDFEKANAAASSFALEVVPSTQDTLLGASADVSFDAPSTEEVIHVVEESIPLHLEPSSVPSPTDPAGSKELEEVRSEMTQIQAELTRVKTLNEKLKAKLRSHMKKEKAKTESVGEYDSSEMKADIEKARQDKLNLEKTAHELREELDEVVRRKDGVIGDLKRKIQQLIDEKARNDGLLEKFEKLVAERDDEINRIAEKANLEVQVLRDEKDFLEKTLQQEKIEYVQELENTKEGYERILSDREQEVDNFKNELYNAKVETEQVKQMLQEAHQSLEELNKLKANFDHIVSGLREDLQQALDEKAAADQIAHEFRVQLKRSESSTGQVADEQKDSAADALEVERSELEAKLQAAQGEVASLRETLESVYREKEDLESLKQKGIEETEGGKVTQDVIDSKDGGNMMEEELPSMSANVQGASNDVAWLQSELKKTLELNRKLKAVLKKKRTRTRSDSREDEVSNEMRAELERIRAAKIDSDRQVTELRLELNNFVKKKEEIVGTLKSKMEQLLQEKERASSLIEQHEKQLLEKDSIVRDITEQCQSLSSDNEALKKSLEELKAINSELQFTVQANVDMESRQQYNQSLISQSVERISQLEEELENTLEKYQKEIADLKQEHEDMLSEKQREVDEAITQLTESNTELQQHIQAISDKKDEIERELSQTKSELEQVKRESYPVIEEKDQKIKELVALMETKKREADDTIAQLQENESRLQEKSQILEGTSTEIKMQLEKIQSELEEQKQEFQRHLDEKDQELREEKESHQKQMQDFDQKFQKLSLRSQDNTRALEEELAQALSDIDNLNAQLQVAGGEKQNIERLQSNFDHIISGLREDLQQALDGKAAADEIAHEFRVQLENMRKSMPAASMEADVNPLLEQNKISEMLEAAQREVADVRGALEVSLKERDDLKNKIKEFELSLEERNKKVAVPSANIDLKSVDKDNVKKVEQEIILQTSVDNQRSAPPTSEAEVELANLKNEMQRMKGLNDKLKAKLKAVMKKKRVKSDSGDEDTCERDELHKELEEARREKLETEKACQELRVELDAFVRQKEDIVNEIKMKNDQLVTENDKSSRLVDNFKRQVEEKDKEIEDLKNEVRGLESDNDQARKNVEELRRENADLCVEIEDLASQRSESEKECSQLKQEQERLVEEYDILLDKKEKTIASLGEQLEDTTEKYKTEIRATKDQYEGIIFRIQSHADSLERERLSGVREIEQLKGQLKELNNEREDINKLKVNFDHIVSSLREDLQHALEGKAAADQIAHEFQVQLKRLEKVSGKLETQYNDVAVDTSELERREEVLQEKLELAQHEADNLREALESINQEKLDFENRIKNLEGVLQERETSDVKIEKEEKDGGQEKIMSEALIQSPEITSIEATACENETLLGSPVQSSFYGLASDAEDVQKIKDDLSKVQDELEKVKTVNERLKVRLKTMIRKTKEAKSGAGDDSSVEELKAELNTTRHEKLESEKAAQELRVELDDFVREKERIINDHKARIQQLLTENEASISLVEDYEKRLLEKDAEVFSLAEQLQSLSEEQNKVSQNLAKTVAENENLKALLEQLQLQKVKTERELQLATAEMDRLLQGDRPLLEQKDQQIMDLGTELSNQKEFYAAEVASVRDRYEAVISEQQNHANNLEQALISANAETEQLKSRLQILDQEREDIDKLRTNFDHIVSGLRNDVQRALEGKAAADEIAYEFQMKLIRLEKSSTSPEVEVRDAGVSTEDMESSGQEREIDELQSSLDLLKEEKEELEERVTGLDELVQDREGNCSNLFL